MTKNFIYFLLTIMHVSYTSTSLLLVGLVISSCTTIELKDVPIYHEAKLDGEVLKPFIGELTDYLKEEVIDRIDGEDNL